MAKSKINDELKILGTRTCNCGGEMIIVNGLDGPGELKYTVRCTKCGIWYETEQLN